MTRDRRRQMVYQAPQPHECSPGWQIGDGNTVPLFPTIGDIWRCNSCGQHWQYQRNPWGWFTGEHGRWQPVAPVGFAR